MLCGPAQFFAAYGFQEKKRHDNRMHMGFAMDPDMRSCRRAVS
jgi:hypothetical protein